MQNMFGVRSSTRALPRICKTSPPLHAAFTALSPASWPAARPLASHRMPSVRLSAARVGVQPAAELRHLQRHKHELRVLGRVGVQPAAELRHLQRHEHAEHVRGALLPVVPCPH
eukprot:scaffold9983_cov47-Phaeocystis_antarctica.AAC.1